MQSAQRDVVKTLFFTLIAADLFFIGAHSVLRGPYLAGDSEMIARFYGRFTIFSDDAIPEYFNYSKWVIAMLFSAVAGFVTGRKGFFGVTVASLFFLADDAGQMHERLGTAMEFHDLPDPLGIGNPAMWEIVGFGMLGLGVGVALLAAWWLSEPRFRRVAPVLILAVVGMTVSGVFLDAIAIAVDNPEGSNLAYEVISVLEDGGELVFISLYTAAVFWIFMQAVAPPRPRDPA